MSSSNNSVRQDANANAAKRHRMLRDAQSRRRDAHHQRVSDNAKNKKAAGTKMKSVWSKIVSVDSGGETKTNSAPVETYTPTINDSSWEAQQRLSQMARNR